MVAQRGDGVVVHSIPMGLFVGASGARGGEVLVVIFILEEVKSSYCDYSGVDNARALTGVITGQ